jgi:hypothetical protein
MIITSIYYSEKAAKKSELLNNFTKNSLLKK